jgi:hypothetical protein
MVSSDPASTSLITSSTNVFFCRLAVSLQLGLQLWLMCCRGELRLEANMTCIEGASNAGHAGIWSTCCPDPCAKARVPVCVLRRARHTDVTQLARFSPMFHLLVRLDRREVVAGITGAGKMLRIGRAGLACSCACAGGAGAGEEGDPREPLQAERSTGNAFTRAEGSAHGLVKRARSGTDIQVPCVMRRTGRLRTRAAGNVGG